MYAQIKSGQIQNIIVLNDANIVSLFYADPNGGSNFDYVIRVDNITPTPSIGWNYDGANFTP